MQPLIRRQSSNAVVLALILEDLLVALFDRVASHKKPSADSESVTDDMVAALDLLKAVVTSPDYFAAATGTLDNIFRLSYHLTRLRLANDLKILQADKFEVQAIIRRTCPKDSIQLTALSNRLKKLYNDVRADINRSGRR